jgi:hypothetical protein
MCARLTWLVSTLPQGSVSQRVHSHAARAPDVGGLVEAHTGEYDLGGSKCEGGLLHE